MTDTQPDTGMGPETPATSTRSNRRTRRLAIIGALALVLVAGAVLVGVKTTGGRSGATYTVGATCANGGTCVLGDVGPGTGTVFFVAPVDFACGTGTTTCRYLEAAPYGWNNPSAPAADPSRMWPAAQSLGVGCTVAGKTDWRLPTQSELAALYKNLTAVNGTAKLSLKYYWSSTLDVPGYYDSQDLKSGSQTMDLDSTVDFVRPVRAF